MGSGLSWGVGCAYLFAVPLIEVQRDDNLAEYAAAVLGLVTGYTVGTAVGVTLIDSHDRFIGTLTGASVGMWLGIQRPYFGGLSILLCPLVGATITSELWRDSAENSRLSIGLAPDPKGRLSTVATLRF